MTREKNKIISKFGLAMTKNMLIAFVLAAGISYVFYCSAQFLTTYGADRITYFKREIEASVEDLQNYINENSLKSTDTEELNNWSDANWHVYMRIFSENQVIYDSVLSFSTEVASMELPGDGEPVKQHSYTLHFKDKDAQAVVIAFFEVRFQTLLRGSCYFLSALIFILAFMILLRKKISYIREIENGIKIIESGSLDYRIPSRGGDELTSLASSINEMSGAISAQREWEQKVKNENYDIITSISHDIRTPLTSVICYLDLIADEKYDSEEKRAEYIRNARAKAYQIKFMADNLFEHSLASNEEISFKYERVSGSELLSELVSEATYSLEEQGFSVEYSDNVGRPYQINVDIHQTKRVFDNLCSNISKYADKSTPITFEVNLRGSMLTIIQENRVAEADVEAESSGIGLKTCKKIVSRHEGVLDTVIYQNRFKVTILLPVSQ